MPNPPLWKLRAILRIELVRVAVGGRWRKLPGAQSGMGLLRV